MGRRRTKRTSFLSIIVLEVGSLLGIVALAQPSIWQTVTGQTSSDNQSANRSGEYAPTSHAYPTRGDYSYLANSQFADSQFADSRMADSRMADSRMVAPLRVARSVHTIPLWATQFPPGP